MDGDILGVVVVGNPAHGIVEVDARGTLVYRPNADFNGSDSFTYRVQDGTAESNIATVTLAINAVNDAPVAQDAQATVEEDGTLHIDFNAYGRDLDGTALQPVIVDGPLHGTLTLQADGIYVYVPSTNYHGVDLIRFRLHDGELLSNPAALAITVVPVNDAPVLSGASLQLDEDGSLTVDALAGAYDADGDPLTLELVEPPAHGSLTLNADGRYTYAPQADFHGTDRFSLRVSDGHATSDVARVQVAIASVNDAPIATDSVAVGEEDEALVLSWADFDIADTEGDALAIRITTLPAEGVLQHRAADDTDTWLDVQAGDVFSQAQIEAGALRFVPEGNASGGPGYAHSGYGNRRSHYARFGYAVSDGQLDTAEVFITVDITALADAPLLAFTGANSSTRELFRTGWEGATNADKQSTLVRESAFGGWTLIAEPDRQCGGADGFEIWASGDQMADRSGNVRAVRAMDGNGSQWLELNNAAGSLPQTLGIERTVQTVAGASYTLSFDVAGRLGFSADYTKIAVYVDDTRLVEISPTSPSSSLDWRTVTAAFTGTGGAQRLRIVTEATRLSDAGRGTMIDDIVLTETTKLNRGVEGSGIPLQGIGATLADSDGSESLVLTVAGMPVGSVLSDGIRHFTVSEAARVANLTGWNTATLVLQPPAHFSGALRLQVQATAIETATGGRATVSKQLVVEVTAVADAPVLNMTARDVNVSRELSSTSWESVANRNKTFTLVTGAPCSTLEGWSVVPAAWGKQTAFEIWSSGDQMRNTAGQLVTVQAASGNGRNWLQLNNGAGQGHQTLGIERSVRTIEGAIYTLTLDYAGALGLKEANTRIGIYIDDQLVGSYANISTLTALNWQELSFQFTGNGLDRRLRIQIEGGNTTSNGRGAMVDDIRIVETLPIGDHLVYGLTGTSIALPIIEARLGDTDGSETLRVELLGMPAGSTLTDGKRTITLTQAGVIDITAWNLATLSLMPPACFTGTLKLQVKATSTEASNGAACSVTQDLTVRVVAGAAAVSPVNVNPYVTHTVATTTTASSAAASDTTTSTQIVVGPMVDETGMLTLSIAAPVSRTWEEEESAEQERSNELTDAWLQELEQFARANWENLAV